MNLGSVVEIVNGKWSCKYMVHSVGKLGYRLQRVKIARTKADNNRFAEYINIKYIGTPIPNK